VTHEELAAYGRLGALRQQARHDTRDTTRAARSAFLARFEREVDPDAKLSPTERARRADAARRAYFASLRLRRTRTATRSEVAVAKHRRQTSAPVAEG
jgi:hypothetical protein